MAPIARSDETWVIARVDHTTINHYSTSQTADQQSVVIC
jgi:hypothetical protein